MLQQMVIYSVASETALAYAMHYTNVLFVSCLQFMV
jgi:hypothetical protein